MNIFEKVNDSLSKVAHGLDLTISKSGKSAIIMKNKYELAIITGRDSTALTVHLRASLLPNEIALLSSLLTTITDIVIDENFDIDYDGKHLIGHDALVFAADNAKNLWFDEEDKDKKQLN